MGLALVLEAVRGRGEIDLHSTGRIGGLVYAIVRARHHECGDQSVERGDVPRQEEEGARPGARCEKRAECPEGR